MDKSKVEEKVITPQYAIYNGDCVDLMRNLPNDSIALTLYSPPFCGLYHYSSDPKDLSNCPTPDSFFNHYQFVIDEITRVTMPGRLSAVHCCDIPQGGGMMDLPGEIIRMHKNSGWSYHARYAIWKEPWRVALRTRAKGLMHRQVVNDMTECTNAAADYIVVFKKNGENKSPVVHPLGLSKYAGSKEIPAGLVAQFSNHKEPKTNRLSHWIWRQYASSFWDDIRIDRVLPYRQARDRDEEKHCHPLQLDVVERLVVMFTNPNEIVMTPFMGVGSEVYGAVQNGRRGIGFELKDSYFRQAVKNMAEAKNVTEQIEFDIPCGEEWPQEEE